MRALEKELDSMAATSMLTETGAAIADIGAMNVKNAASMSTLRAAK